MGMAACPEVAVHDGKTLLRVGSTRSMPRLQHLHALHDTGLLSLPPRGDSFSLGHWTPHSLPHTHTHTHHHAHTHTPHTHTHTHTHTTVRAPTHMRAHLTYTHTHTPHTHTRTHAISFLNTYIHLVLCWGDA